MTLEQFHNGIRLLYSIDAHELGNPSWWEKFRDDPPQFFIRCDDERAAHIFAVMKKRT
jgi:hypothetical protein